MSADESLSRYQLGKYMFTRERSTGGLWEGEADTPQTSYKMYREPNAEEWAEEPEVAEARDVGTLMVSHHPPDVIPPALLRRRVGNAAAKAAMRQPGVFEHLSKGGEMPTGGDVTGKTVVTNRAWKERHAPTDEVHLLTVAKESRTMVPTMLALGQRAAKETTGQDLQASRDLSVHSQRLVDRFKEAGLVPESHTATRNRINFLPPIPTGAAGGLEGFLSHLQYRKRRYGSMVDVEEPIDLPEVEQAKTEGREIVRRTRPWPKGS